MTGRAEGGASSLPRRTPDIALGSAASSPHLIGVHATVEEAAAMTDFQPGYHPGYTDPARMSGPGGYPVPYVRASLGGRTVAYLLDLAFIFVFRRQSTLTL